MFCKNCGKELDSYTSFCPSCGAEVSETSTQSTNTQQGSLYEKRTFILGLLSVVFSGLNYFGIPVVHLVGIVLGIIGISYAKKDSEIYGVYSRPGKILSIVGLVLGAVAFLYGVIYVILNPDAVA